MKVIPSGKAALRAQKGAELANNGEYGEAAKEYEAARDISRLPSVKLAMQSMVNYCKEQAQ